MRKIFLTNVPLTKKKFMCRAAIIILLSMTILIFKSKRANCCAHVTIESQQEDLQGLQNNEALQRYEYHSLFPQDGYLIKI